MTIKESILKSLEDLNGLASASDIYNHILDKNYYKFGAKNPLGIVSAMLGEFIKNGDSRIKRSKVSGENYKYYLTKIEKNLLFDQLDKEVSFTSPKLRKDDYKERDLHKLLTSFLKSTDIYAKTIFHEQSSNSKDNHQKWIHPDIVGIQFLNLHSKVNQTFLKAINKLDVFKISSFELKREINSDYELKKTFFQAVSNSSWANYGYLVAFEISESLNEEMERLNQSFGIGIIELKANPYESKILFPSKYKDLDFKTIDKLCKINKDFESFIEQIEKLMTASDKYYRATEKELEEFCDKYFLNDTEIEDYCKQKNIPMSKGL
ncbi:hypothetical protein [Myroides marinus]|uniref:hypothetical protein n=1 Tax=Myroides marinus TaxID=703342 RepID=UPI002576543E|nr:hypothetical protein [Myroides marinus]MDM1377709.1 hypothetical protein [Myroides marinus]MDM1385087.1 hypothetical protein [Myroides marinus]MDM1392193.1 hypothetical protein [Myroides marinus]